MQRREITLQQLEHDLDRAKEKYKDAVEENGRLEARVQAFAINAQSEQDVLSTEVAFLFVCLVGWFLFFFQYWLFITSSPI